MIKKNYMNKRVAIHHRDNSFSIKWIEFCEINNIYYEIVDAFDSDIINKLKEFDVFLFHWHHNDLKSAIAMNSIISSLSYTKTKCFPDWNTSWFFDNKVAQKYLFEAVDIPLIDSNVFYRRSDAFNYIENVKFPIVFKLKGGAGSSNVKLIKSIKEAKKLVKKAFSSGFPTVDRKQIFIDSLHRFFKEFNFLSFKIFLKSAVRLIIKTESEKVDYDGYGYIYFQKFIPNNNFDIRIIVIGNKAFAIKRYVRTGDFRASGSGFIEYPGPELDSRCISLAFDTSKRLNSQCIAFDFIYDENNPVIVEVSYGFSKDVYLPCPGYWDNNLNWHDGRFTPEFFMIEQLLNS